MIALPDDDEPFGDNYREATGDVSEEPAQGFSEVMPRHTLIRANDLEEAGDPIDPEDLVGFKGVFPSGSLGGIFGDDFVRSFTDPIVKHMEALKLSESVTKALSQASKVGVHGIDWLKVAGFTNSPFPPDLGASTARLISSAIDTTSWMKDFQGLASTTWMKDYQGLAGSGWLKDLPGLTGIGSFTDSLFADAQLQAMIPAFTMPDLGLPSFITDFDVEALLRSLKLQHVPSNWVDIDLDPDDAEESIRAVLADGIPLGWVPSERVVQLLLDATDAPARRRVVTSNWRGILNDCDTVLGELPAPRALRYADKLRRAISALRDGHTDASQALATNLLDTLVGHFVAPALGVPRSTLVNPTWNHNLLADGWRLALSLLPLETVMRGSFGVDHTGTGFRRNATVHAVTERQYNRINATIAIMLATSVLACAVRDTSAFD